MAQLYVDHVKTSGRDISPLEDDEHLLLQRLAQGDRAAFWGIWERYRPLLFSRYCLRWMGGNREEAEDALSSACLKAWEHLPTYAWQMTNVKSWLIRLVYNHCMDIRRTQVRRARIVQDMSNRSGAGEGQRTSTYQSPEDIVCGDDVMKTIHQAMDHLPPGLRQPASLRLFRDMPYAEIAGHLDLSPENARKRVQQARSILQLVLHGDAVGGLAPKTWNAPRPDKAIMPQRARQAKRCHAPIHHQGVAPRKVTMRILCVPLSSGVEWHVYLPFECKPVRQQQKLDALRAYIQQHPEGWKKRLELAQLLYAIGHWEDAAVAYRQVVQKQPRCGVAWLGLGELCHLLTRTTEAMAAYERALSCMRQEAMQHHVRGLIAVCEQRAEEAVQAFERAATCEPQNAAHWHALGSVHLHTAAPDAALRAYDQALQADPDDSVALIHSFDALYALGRHADAESRLARVLQVDADNVLALRRMADMRICMGRVQGKDGKRVAMLLQRALRLAPHAPDVYATMAYYHGLSGEPARGLALLQRFIEQHPHSMAGWYYMAHWQARCGDIRAAADAILYADVLRQNRTARPYILPMLDPELQHPDVLRLLVADMLSHFPRYSKVWTTAGQVILPTSSDRGHM